MTTDDLRLDDRSDLQILSNTGSTNDEAREWATRGAKDGATVVSDAQTGGRGRYGRTWHSPPGCNLHLSQIVRIQDPDRQRLVPLMGAVAARETIQWQLGPGNPTLVKWPNDILVEGKKIAGILTEMVAGEHPFCILGIGVNVNLDPSELPSDLRRPASSVQAVLGHKVDRGLLLAHLLDELQLWRQRLADEPLGLVQRLREHCLTLGTRVRVRPPGQPEWAGQALSIDDDGTLLVENSTGHRVRVESGEVDPIHL